MVSGTPRHGRGGFGPVVNPPRCPHCRHVPEPPHPQHANEARMAGTWSKAGLRSKPSREATVVSKALDE